MESWCETAQTTDVMEQQNAVIVIDAMTKVSLYLVLNF